MLDYEYMMQHAHFIETDLNKGNDLLVAWLVAILIEHCWSQMQAQKRTLEQNAGAAG